MIGQIARNAFPPFLVFLVAGFAVYAVDRGLSLYDPVEIASSRFIHSGALLSNLAIYAHMALGGLLTALAPLQGLPWLRTRYPRVHHVNGYLIGALACATSVGGLFYIARHGTIGGPIMSVGFALYGMLLLVAAVQTIRFARRRDPRHREWALRFIVLAVGSWLFRVHYGVWEIATGGAYTAPDFSGAFDRVQTFGFYLPYLAVLELVLWRQRRTRPL